MSILPCVSLNYNCRKSNPISWSVKCSEIILHFQYSHVYDKRLGSMSKALISISRGINPEQNLKTITKVRYWTYLPLVIGLIVRDPSQWIVCKKASDSFYTHHLFINSFKHYKCDFLLSSYQVTSYRSQNN